ncbi:hypothetical protein [Alteribacter keqinensis]|uniref:Uncharacterized protein n=1 Tax=Alteribacter keqinensis TaxID=2483800 RepID=A0A3M7TWX3_9BACI|nr:hypothetical protein [Alteribacter keqinensis]RNA70130.1 hypothetical protein EBO34_09435 [Alteribacter keqinensis]
MNDTIKKASTVLYSTQMKWAAWYLPIVYIVYILVISFVPEPEVKEMSLLTFVFQTATIFMLVCGILSCFAFLTLFVKQGLTRRTYFLATSLSGIALAVSIIIITAVVTWLLTFTERFTTLFDNVTLSTIGGTEPQWVLTVISYILVIFIYFLAGWLISAGFYGYGASGGFATIAAALILVFVTDFFWNFNTPQPVAGLLPVEFQGASVIVSLASSIILITLILFAIRKLTKRIRIKMY